MKRFSFFLAACLCLFVLSVPLMDVLAAPCDPNSTELCNPLGTTSTINQFIGRLINAVLGISGAVALVMFVWGGVQWLISGGSAEKIKQAKATLVSAAIGIVILFTSYTLVNAIIQALASGTVQ